MRSVLRIGVTPGPLLPLDIEDDSAGLTSPQEGHELEEPSFPVLWLFFRLYLS